MAERVHVGRALKTVLARLVDNPDAADDPFVRQILEDGFNDLYDLYWQIEGQGRVRRPNVWGWKRRVETLMCNTLALVGREEGRQRVTSSMWRQFLIDAIRLADIIGHELTHNTRVITCPVDISDLSRDWESYVQYVFGRLPDIEAVIHPPPPPPAPV